MFSLWILHILDVLALNVFQEDTINKGVCTQLCRSSMAHVESSAFEGKSHFFLSCPSLLLPPSPVSPFCLFSFLHSTIYIFTLGLLMHILHMVRFNFYVYNHVIHIVRIYIIYIEFPHVLFIQYSFHPRALPTTDLISAICILHFPEWINDKGNRIVHSWGGRQAGFGTVVKGCQSLF